ncbi:dihydrolipoyllysine-residue acetyltransferase [Aquabacterium sp. CECT 9606]|uniref:dihydrolipoyllysine-residue acetyltransferase n=1 Tax=Aquabacterium sp. CECT 9606 TaxID=2845822 RepID=UPI001E655117|nr:dihydrolipoyllysine-residue acetyltransferase [Aquabacterium sp. CECT 9606]CAH0352729.1 Dihydrolipoyllysine-residue acetyltransferase component of pyruvate dehydrogenase complex [Aquabacterium sp. CECT 9606]
MALTELKVPDIGDTTDAAVIEILVKVGDTVKAEQSLITLESDKASMEVPAAQGGVVKEIKLKLGDKVSEGALIALVESAEAAPTPSPSPANDAPSAASGSAEPESAAVVQAKTQAAELVEPVAAPSSRIPPTAALPPAEPPAKDGHVPHASPSVRRFARELGVALGSVQGSAPKGRITHADVQAFVKAALAKGSGAAVASPGTVAEGEGLNLLPWPKVDFAKYGPIERQPLSRIKKLSGANLHRNWVRIPHVTNNEEADITDLEALRVKLNEEHAKTGPKFTMLAFLIKACAVALKKFPQFNASLDGDDLVLKQYVHIGFAADTPNGLVVPVIRDADTKGLSQLAAETAALAAKAREGKLSPADMQGGTFSISSLGGFGGTTFTPIINAPEVAILGVCRAAMKPVWNGSGFDPRLIIPLSLSYDHRVIDGASAARFNAFLATLLADFRRAIL